MEQKIILASHGKLASGMLSSLELICGKNEKISALDCYLTEEFDLSQEVMQVVEDTKNNEVVVITDLFGGSVNNEFLAYVNLPNFYLVAGLNLPFLIEFTTKPFYGSIEETIKLVLESSKETIQFCNETIQTELIEEEF
ncbi:PTS sugar transporter subunit IIA [Enterococcus rivorum]|uniref:PTS mannose transporter subunit IIA n=1 Tax=Enterococcus rivorum TaxID=762845 RepID=A0A1E5KSY9_9ENTE|nr:PTS sugar transporter subunit IIA [Enterococcus rivorum]MBP2098055.1 fructoselysine and glucoselysine-specific PTS system IIA component [Enterococcus rivorum]OEH81002.1 PTS mannose transporter subunit IIA [Enterococcus rivorum]